MAGAKLTMKNPPTAISRIFGPEKGPKMKSANIDDEASETYHLSADELKELNETGTVHCSEGCTITADIGGEESGEGETPPM